MRLQCGRLTIRNKNSSRIIHVQVIVNIDFKIRILYSAVLITNSASIAASLAVLERKVLIIDADPQANTTSGLNFPPESDQKRTLYEVMIGQIGVRDALIQTEMNNLHLIPSHINLVGIEFEMINEENRESILKNCLAPIRNEYDYIIIDCSPSLGLMTINCLTAADSVIIPVQPEF